MADFAPHVAMLEAIIQVMLIQAEEGAPQSGLASSPGPALVEAGRCYRIMATCDVRTQLGEWPIGPVNHRGPA